jgi:CRISPR-associated protein Cas5t
MKALRIILTQTKAHYKKEEVDQNKLTYPLPPFSTVIGAIHNACGFKEYKPMDLSIQGDYKSLSKQAYTDHCFLDNTHDDRGILVKLVDGNYQSKAFSKIAQAKRGQGNNFRKGITIDIFDQILLEEYRNLKDLNDKLIEFKKEKLDKIVSLIGKRKKALKEKKKNMDKNTKAFITISKREEEIKSKEKLIKDKFDEFKLNNYTNQIAKYQTLTTSLKYYEVLHEVKLVIHIKADDITLETIMENIFNLKAIGRSEDFVDVKQCEYVELQDEVEDEITSSYSAYLNYDLVKRRQVLLNKRKNDIPASGTKYWINKKYDKSKGFREFEKVKVVYASNFYIDDESEDIFYDGKYIVNFN